MLLSYRIFFRSLCTYLKIYLSFLNIKWYVFFLLTVGGWQDSQYFESVHTTIVNAQFNCFMSLVCYNYISTDGLFSVVLHFLFYLIFFWRFSAAYEPEYNILGFFFHSILHTIQGVSSGRSTQGALVRACLSGMCDCYFLCCKQKPFFLFRL